MNKHDRSSFETRSSNAPQGERKNQPRIVLTPGEPAGIGPDITIAIAQKSLAAELIVIADPDVLFERAEALHLPLQCHTYDPASPRMHEPQHLTIMPVKVSKSVIPGTLNMANANYVMQSLELAATLCLQKKADALVTGPVHKALLNEAGISFSGHTEFLARFCDVKQTVMLFLVNDLKVALATTHLPLSQVPAAITQPHLTSVLNVLLNGLKQQFHLSHPRILVCGLNPHAGENGYLGKEEINIITPVLKKFREEGHDVIGPLSADTAFLPAQTKQADAILAMYHDQALPIVKYIGFDRAVNVTLGLPFIRTSVDHGTALDLAGTGRAESSSLEAAIEAACDSIIVAKK